MPYVVSDGVLRNLDKAQLPKPYNLQITDNYFSTYGAIFKAQPAVRTVISFLARNVAQLGMHVYRRVSDTDRERVTDGPLADVIKKPNPFTTQYRMLSTLIHDLCIYDIQFQLKVGSTSAPSLVRIAPWRVQPKGDNWLQADAYEVTGSRGKQTIPADRWVVMHGYNPDDDRVGCSSLEALRTILAEEWEAGKMRQDALRNGARFTGYIKRPADAPDWTGPAKERFKLDWANQYTSGGVGPGGTPILEDGMDWVAASQTAEQLQYVEARKLTREEVAAAYFIPPPMVGILDHATFSNIVMQHQMLYQDTLGPVLEMIVQEYMAQLLPDIPGTDDMYLEFNLKDKLRGSFEEETKSLQTATGGPIMTRNEARARQNLPAIDGGDELIVPLNVTVGGQASPTDSAPKSSELVALQGQLSGVIAEFLGRQGKSVMSRLGATPGDDWWDAKRWHRELVTDLMHAGVDEVTANHVAVCVNSNTEIAINTALKAADPRAEVAAIFQAAPARAETYSGLAAKGVL